MTKYGIWNRKRNKFQFGICENTKWDALMCLKKKIGNDARKYRFIAKEIPSSNSDKLELEDSR